MRRPIVLLTVFSLSLWTMASLPGCGAPARAKLAEMFPIGNPPNLAPHEAEQRQKFQTERDPAAFRWLLVHRVHNEMTVEEVANVLGEAGERRFDDAEFKTNGGFYQTTDIGYQWGPDRSGHSVVLFFREGKLINFDPMEL